MKCLCLNLIKSTMIGQTHKYLILVLLHGVQVLSFPMDSFVYEANPIQKISFNYDDNNTSGPLKFKLQTSSFRIFEQLDGLNSESNIGETRSRPNNVVANEIDEKYKQLSRFTVFYTSEDNKPEDVNKNNINSKPNMTTSIDNFMNSTKINDDALEEEKESRENSDTNDSQQLNIDTTTDYTEYKTTMDIINESERELLNVIKNNRNSKPNMTSSIDNVMNSTIINDNRLEDLEKESRENIDITDSQQLNIDTTTEYY